MPDTVIDDLRLIKFLDDNIENFGFFSPETKEVIQEILSYRTSCVDTEHCLEEIFNPSQNNTLNILDFWQSLLIDAIKFLKTHDASEIKRDETNTVATLYNTISKSSLGVGQLKDYFIEFIEFESLLYGAEGHYRDHVLHVIRVWLTGQILITEHLSADFPLIIPEEHLPLLEETDACSPIGSTILNKDEENAIWCIIALSHDLGYPLGKIEQIGEKLRSIGKFFANTNLPAITFNFPVQNHFINEIIIKYISSKVVKDSKSTTEKNESNGLEADYNYRTAIQAKYYLKFSKSYEKFEHGIISCILLMKNLTYFLETNFDWGRTGSLIAAEARQFVIRREILRAIASHTCHEIYHLQPNSFGFILILADELQFWGRPTFFQYATRSREKFTVKILEFTSSKVEFSIVGEKSNEQARAESLAGFFISKAEMFNTILRVAADYVDKRRFLLKFEVRDSFGDTYSFSSQQNDATTYYLNDLPISFDDLCKIREILSSRDAKKEEWGIYSRYTKET